jgi:hypothetical protein
MRRTWGEERKKKRRRRRRIKKKKGLEYRKEERKEGRKEEREKTPPWKKKPKISGMAFAKIEVLLKIPVQTYSSWAFTFGKYELGQCKA